MPSKLNSLIVSPYFTLTLHGCTWKMIIPQTKSLIIQDRLKRKKKFSWFLVTPKPQSLNRRLNLNYFDVPVGVIKLAVRHVQSVNCLGKRDERSVLSLFKEFTFSISRWKIIPWLNANHTFCWQRQNKSGDYPEY